MSHTEKDRIIRSLSGKQIPSGSFPEAIAGALHREYGGTQSAVKTVIQLTAANPRAVKNWFAAKNAPNAEFLIALCRHSDEVLETFLLLAGRNDHVKVRKLVDLKKKVREMLIVIEGLE
jgi:hypothetical protein